MDEFPPPSADEPKPISVDQFDHLHKLIKPQPGESRWMEIEWHPNVWEARQKGDKLSVAPAISERLARFHLSPARALTSEDRIVPKSAIKKSDMELVVEDVTVDRIRLGLSGFIHWGTDYEESKATSPNGPLDLGFASLIHGMLEYDRTRKAFVRFDIVAPGDVWGRWADANGKSMGVERAGRNPIGFALELTTGQSPSDRLPPGGHGGRALRAGYLSTGK